MFFKIVFHSSSKIKWIKKKKNTKAYTSTRKIVWKIQNGVVGVMLAMFENKKKIHFSKMRKTKIGGSKAIKEKTRENFPSKCGCVHKQCWGEKTFYRQRKNIYVHNWVFTKRHFVFSFSLQITSKKYQINLVFLNIASLIHFNSDLSPEMFILLFLFYFFFVVKKNQ